MAYNKFSLNIILRVILILANCIFLAKEYVLGDYLITIINLAILLFLQTIFLIRYLRRLNLQTIEYFELIKNKESGFRLKNTTDKNSFSKLRKQFNDTNQIIQDIRIEKEIQTNYLNHLVNYINVGLFSFDENEKIQFINPEAKRIFGIENIFKLNDLNILNKNFTKFLRHIKPGESEVIKISEPAIKQKLSVNCGLLNLKGSEIKLVSFQDIDKHLYKNEIESWNKLIRILNHEIMNSITPITSLSKTMKKYFYDGETINAPEKIPSASINRTVEGLEIIEERGVGLINFVNNYRQLSSLPKPNKTKINIHKLLVQTKSLFSEEFESKNIDIKIEVNPTDLVLNADKEQISQVLINLVKNSLQAIQNKKEGKITLLSSKQDNKIHIAIKDNGKGIPDDLINDIFIPFYTTSETGSGIGLSISKQIMKMHDGTISVSSIPNESTEFSLVFNNI
jgi:nitrogen fixation/metabolism regulation signal transduction histidine kinase